MELLKAILVMLAFYALLFGIGGFLLKRKSSQWKKVFSIITWPVVAPVRFCFRVCKGIWDRTPDGQKPNLAFMTFGVLGYLIANQPKFPPVEKKPAWVPDELTTLFDGKSDAEMKLIWDDVDSDTWALHDPAFSRDNWFTHVYLQMRKRGLIPVTV